MRRAVRAPPSRRLLQPQRSSPPNSISDGTLPRPAISGGRRGSQIVPYDYYTALEVKDSQELFASNAHSERLRLITVSDKTTANPGGLPIGFVKNQAQVNGLDVMGVTCAACHSAKWKVNGTDVMIEGGPSKGDFQTFFFELIDSMTQTLAQADKFDRFAKRVGGDASALKAGLTTWLARLQARIPGT